MVNKATIIGHLGQDPEIKNLESGASIAKLRVATNENYKDKEGNWQDRTEWHTAIGWSYLAERAEKTMKKGSLVYIEGKLTTRKWQKDGKDVYSTEVVAKDWKCLDKKEGGHSQTSDDGGNYKAKAKPSNNPQEAADDDLPF